MVFLYWFLPSNLKAMKNKNMEFRHKEYSVATFASLYI